MFARTPKSKLMPLVLMPVILVMGFLALASPAFAVQAKNVAISKVGATSAVLVVKSDVASDVTVDYGVNPLVYSNTKTSLAGTRHEITLDSLAPGAAIHYRVTITDSSNPALSIVIPDKSFQSARSSGAGFNFAVLGDNRPAYDTVVQPAAFDSIISQMLGEELDLSLNVGDIIYGVGSDSLAQNVAKYEGLFVSTTPLTYSVPMYVAAGNHERLAYANSRAGFEQEFTLPVNNGAEAGTYGEHYYSVNNGDTHIVALSTEIPGQEGLITGAQKAWLAADLAANTRPWVVVFMHRPLFSGAHGGDPWTNTGNVAGQQNKAEIHALFRQYGVDVVFAGHEHFYLHHLQDGIHYIITGGGGAPVSPAPALQPGDIYAYGGYEHMLVAEGDSTLKVSAIDAAGSTLESFKLGTPTLGLTSGQAYWASYADYESHTLSVTLTINNTGNADANNVTINSMQTTNDVELLTATPLSLGNLAGGGAVTTTLQFHIPGGVSSFLVSSQGSCVDDVGDTYSYPVTDVF